MPSIVYGPGKREGQAAEPPARPISAWECLADKVPDMPQPQQRRVSMLMLRVVCCWRLEDIGHLFELHKGHVSREVDRARLEVAVILKDAGVDVSPEIRPDDADPLDEKITVRLTITEKRTLGRMSGLSGRSDSKQARQLILRGGLLLEDPPEGESDAITSAEVPPCIAKAAQG